MTSHPAITLLLTALAVGTGCEQVENLMRDSTPHKLSFIEPTKPVHGRDQFSLDARILNAGGETLSEHTVSISAIPTDVLGVAGDQLSCLKSGDATVSLAGAGLSANATVKCRIVAELRVLPAELRLIAQTDARQVAVTVLDDAGKPMTDIEYQVTSTSPAVLTVLPDRKGLQPNRMGKATVIFRAGSVKQALPVVVIERVKTDPLALGDGASTTYSLERGNYEVEVNVTGGRVSATWVGEKCASHPEAHKLKTACNINNAASLVLNNPTAFGLGSAAMGNLIMYRVPAE